MYAFKKIKYLYDYTFLCVFQNKEKVLWNAEKSLKKYKVWSVIKEDLNNLVIEDGVLIYRFSEKENDYFDICPDLIYMESDKYVDR